MFVPNVGLVIDQVIYDTLSFAIGATTGQYFTVPYGGILTGAVTKDWNHTNLVQASRLEAGYKFIVKGIGFFVKEKATAVTTVDIRNFQEGYCRLIVADSVLLTIPIAMAPGGGAELVQTAAATTVAATTLENYTRGLAAVQNFYPMLENPLELSPQQTFRVDIGGLGAMIAESQFTCFLKGTLTRPVVG